PSRTTPTSIEMTFASATNRRSSSRSSARRPAATSGDCRGGRRRILQSAVTHRRVTAPTAGSSRSEFRSSSTIRPRPTFARHRHVGGSAEHPPVRLLKGNLHAHTTFSDGRRPIREVIRRYRDLGYDFLAITDHDDRVHGDYWFDIPA